MKIIYRHWVRLLFPLMCVPFLMMAIRRRLYGEDNISAANSDYILHLGPGRAARIREHASTRLQRCHCHLIHVRPLPKVDAQLGEGVVSPSAGLQQVAFLLASLSCRENPEHRRLRRFHATSRKRSQNRPSASPKRCTSSLIFCSTSASINVQKTFKIVLARHLTSNATFLRSRESASLYCSTLICERLPLSHADSVALISSPPTTRNRNSRRTWPF